MRLAAALLLCVACTSGPPPGFSGGAGKAWSIPLVGPLEDGELVVAVTIDGEGPFLFAIDPDANTSLIDEQLVKRLSPKVAPGPRRLDETDTQRPRFYADILGIELGELNVAETHMMITAAGSLDVDGRRVMGVLGRDVLADSLVFGFDRERGLAYLTTVKSFTPPPNAIKLAYEHVPSHIENAQVVPMPRRLVRATVNGAPFTLHLDLGERYSQLREAAWEKAALTGVPAKGVMIDEAGTPRQVSQIAKADNVMLGTQKLDHIGFVPYDDKRWPSQDLDGTLGLDAMRPFNVFLDWDKRAYYLAPRAAVATKTRVERWDNPALHDCPHLACVQVRAVDPLAGKAAPDSGHPGVVLVVERDERANGVGLEILLEAKDRPDLPRLAVSMPANASRAMQHLKGEFAGAVLEVVDASPFPRSCPGSGSCVDLIAR